MAIWLASSGWLRREVTDDVVFVMVDVVFVMADLDISSRKPRQHALSDRSSPDVA